MLTTVMRPLVIAPGACTAASHPGAGQPRPATPPTTPLFVAPFVRTSDPAVAQRSFLRDCLEGLNTPEDLRVRLAADLPKADLAFVGFDGLTLAECIDHVVSEALRSRQQPDDARALTALAASMDLYLAVLRETRVRRSIGRDSCLPTIR